MSSGSQRVRSRSRNNHIHSHSHTPSSSSVLLTHRPVVHKSSESSIAGGDESSVLSSADHQPLLLPDRHLTGGSDGDHDLQHASHALAGLGPEGSQLSASSERVRSGSTKRRRHKHLTIRKHLKRSTSSHQHNHVTGSISNDHSDDSQPVYEVESVLDIKLENGAYFFLIKWKGYADHFNSWEPEQHLEPELLADLGFRKDSIHPFTHRPKTRSSPPASPVKTLTLPSPPNNRTSAPSPGSSSRTAAPATRTPAVGLQTRSRRQQQQNPRQTQQSQQVQRTPASRNQARKQRAEPIVGPGAQSPTAGKSVGRRVGDPVPHQEQELPVRRSAQSSRIDPSLLPIPRPRPQVPHHAPPEPLLPPPAQPVTKMTIKQLISMPAVGPICESMASSSGVSSGSMSSSSSSCSVVSDSDLPVDPYNQMTGIRDAAEEAAVNEIKHLVLTDALVPGKIVQMSTSEEGKKIALIKWYNHSALTWIEYEMARIRYPDLVLDYYESLLVFDP